MPKRVPAPVVVNVDPVAAWLEGTDPEAQEGVSSPSYDKPAHEYGEDFPAPDAPDEPPAEPDPVQAPAVVELGVPDDASELAARSCPAGHPCTAVAKFCPECGSLVDQPEPVDWDCGNGHLNPAAAKFCPECGAERPVSPAPVAPVAGAGALAEIGARVDRAPAAVVDSLRPKPYAAMSPAERAAADREHIAALQGGQQDVAPRYAPGTRHSCACHQTGRVPGGQWPCPTCSCMLIHFVKDGLTFAGVVWMRGQEIEIGPDHPRWVEVQDWIFMDDAAQMLRWEDVRFRAGPWPGRRSYADGAANFEQLREPGGDFKQARVLGAPSPEALAQADQRERARQRRVPMPTM